jgi:putative restriction endonuclease
MSKPDSPYADTATSYEFPAQYLKWFGALSDGERMLAVIYEPSARGAGRQSFVGWVWLSTPPVRSPRRTTAGAALSEARYDGRVQEFDTPVPRDIAGEPIEGWLRDVQPEHRSVRTSGRSVRPISDGDLQTILLLGGSPSLTPPGTYPMREEHETALVAAERTRRLVSALERSATFRSSVVRAYDFRCSITQFSAGIVPLGRVTALIEAAHIRPVSDRGPDVLTNGVAMTPTVHKLFDAGLFTLRSAIDGGLEVQTSAALDRGMIESPDGRSRIELRDGARLLLPPDTRKWPSAEQIHYHQRHIFQGPAAFEGSTI